MVEQSQVDKRQKLKDDFEFYARNCLFIRGKDGKIAPFTLNKAQKYIHGKIENQLHQTGKVRAIILKGRQQGCSTYTEGRFYWKVTHRRGVRAFILTHEQQATDNLFELAQRYHEHCPPLLKPQTDAASAKEMSFGGIDSGYKVGTAGSKGVGRSSTIQYFHGSEVAFWPNADTHAVGVMQAIPDLPGTEVILESTANGLGNYYHDQWKKAESGQSDYIAIFVPWFWQDEYVRNADDIELTDDEEKLKQQYDLSLEQISWRRNKIIELSAGGVNGEVQFKQEYPMNAAEAFQMSGRETLITSEMAHRARKNSVAGAGAKILGVDPSLGGDRFAMVMRQGGRMYRMESYVRDAVATLELRAAKVARVIQEENPDRVFIDAGFGADLADYLRSIGFSKIQTISFGGSPLDDKRFYNKRAEMYGLMADWLNDEGAMVTIPDSDEFQSDICACPYTVDAHNRVKILPKDKIKEIFGFSPDYGDAAALTFAMPVVVSRQQVVTRAKKFNPYK